DSDSSSSCRSAGRGPPRAFAPPPADRAPHHGARWRDSPPPTSKAAPRPRVRKHASAPPYLILGGRLVPRHTPHDSGLWEGAQPGEADLHYAEVGHVQR